MSDRILYSLGAAPWLLLLIVAIFLPACSTPNTETLIKGDRDVTQVSVGRLNDGNGNYRLYFVLRDANTGVDYLAVVDAGIVQLQPKSAGKAKPIILETP